MRKEPPLYFVQNKRLHRDHLLGLRGFGLILYGTLPSTLAAVGALRPPELLAPGAYLAVPFLFVALFPLTILFLLVRQRMSTWYELDAGLGVRSTVVTMMILLSASAVTGSTAILKGRYSILPMSEWLSVATWVRPLAECVLLAVAFLVGTSTLFLIGVKDSGGLPALPSASRIEELAKMREEIGSMLADKIWEASSGVDSVSEHLAAAKKHVSNLVQYPCRTATPQSLMMTQLQSDMSMLGDALGDIQSVPQKWDTYFSTNLSVERNHIEQARKIAITRIASLAGYV
jgi:hypothetical protein